MKYCLKNREKFEIALIKGITGYYLKLLGHGYNIIFTVSGTLILMKHSNIHSHAEKSSGQESIDLASSCY